MIDRRQFIGASVAAALSSVAFGQDETARPNVVLIFCDDLGYQDLSCFGSEKIATPNIDRMAAEGVRFTDFYSASPVCTPSRAALLTGSYPARVGLQSGVLFPNAKIGLNPNEVTIAKLLKERGYATMCIGKWHLGDAAAFSPKAQGFDAYFGVPYSNDMRIKRGDKLGPPLMRDGEIVEHPADQGTLTERYTEEAIRFITANKERPFFLYLPHTMPHVPLFVSERFKGKSKGGLYGDVVETIDWSVGRILASLKQLNLDGKTLVIFTSDNGPWLIKKEHGGAARPLRDGKGTTYEGGMRVPTIMRWPGKIAAGRKCDEVACMMDLLPTIAGLAGASVPKDRVIDGKDIAPLLLSAEAKSPRETYFYHASAGPLQAVRSGKWKLHLPRRERVQQKDVDRPAELYDLSVDVGETRNVAAGHPDVVERLTKLCQAHRDDLQKNSRPVGRVGPPSTQPAKERGVND